jgi:hypothetical protein
MPAQIDVVITRLRAQYVSVLLSAIVYLSSTNKVVSVTLIVPLQCLSQQTIVSSVREAVGAVENHVRRVGKAAIVVQRNSPCTGWPKHGSQCSIVGVYVIVQHTDAGVTFSKILRV